MSSNATAWLVMALKRARGRCLAALAMLGISNQSHQLLFSLQNHPFGYLGWSMKKADLATEKRQSGTYWGKAEKAGFIANEMDASKPQWFFFSVWCVMQMPPKSIGNQKFCKIAELFVLSVFSFIGKTWYCKALSNTITSDIRMSFHYGRQGGRRLQ